MLGDRTSNRTSRQTPVTADARGLSSVAYFLIVHGSRNPAYNAAIAQLTALVDQELIAVDPLAKATTLVDVGFLEVHPDPLHAQIAGFADRVSQQGIYHIQLLPLFLLPGVHTLEDVPREVAIALEMIAPKIALEILPYLGTQTTGLSRLLMSQIAAVKAQDPATVWILFSHGSRRPGGNESVEAIAHQLAKLSGVEVVVAYSFVSPFLSDRVAQLWQIGHRRITILPYVLFPGELTQAIANSITELCQTFANLKINLAQPIGPTTYLAKFIVSIPRSLSDPTVG